MCWKLQGRGKDTKVAAREVSQEATKQEKGKSTTTITRNNWCWHTCVELPDPGRKPQPAF